MTDTRREAALRSALGRLPLAVFIVDGQRLMRPLNAKATELMEVEGLRGDLVDARPSHPLAALILGIIHGSTGNPVSRIELTFPRGTRYVAEPSRRSEKGLEHWLILLLDEVRLGGGGNADRLLEEWNLTDREQEAATLMTQGLTTRDICETMQIAPTTLKSHVKQILAKSGSRTRSQFLSKLLSGK